MTCLAVPRDKWADEMVPWCNQAEHSDITNNIKFATCTECFMAVEEYYLKVRKRAYVVGPRSMCCL